jgi:ATP-dependent helicase/nuclease subunit B
VKVEIIKRDPIHSRFNDSPLLAHIERNWAAPASFPRRSESVRVVTCANSEGEAVFAAREILRFVRERGARFRDCAVLLRTLDGYHATVRRVFTRYGVPFFLDRRESIAHHPLAELTRCALRVAAFGWRNEDWFGVLKTGLVHRGEDDLDQFENEALARGWESAKWTRPLPGQAGKAHRFESLRRDLIPPFEKLNRAVGSPLDGPQLAAAIRALWADLDVEGTLQRWTKEMKRIEPSLPAMHETVLSQMESWLENVERAFTSQSLDVRDWLPILEAGLAGLTVGVIPPSLDQVLVGAIDRSRNPDLRLAFVLGMNETIFPAPPPRAPILTEAERRFLAGWAAGRKRSLGISTRQRIAHERFYGYIACTRSREQVVLTCAAANNKGVAWNPSPFLAHLERLVPGAFPADAEQREYFTALDWHDAQHLGEIAAPLIDGAHPELAPLKGISGLADVLQRAERFGSAIRRPDVGGTLKLAPALVTRLFPSPLHTSVSALEDFAACPFKFFVKHGLRIREREVFEVDHRQKGIFQHEVLSRFHQRATAEGRRWRDWPASDAAALVREIGEALLKSHHYGLFDVDDGRRFTGDVLLQNLERLVSTLVTWMAHYQFDPRAVELEFGLGESSLPGWRLRLGQESELVLCGRIDRIDVCERAGGPPLGIVVDYKSSGKKVDAIKLHNGLELQLLSYLGFLRQLAPGAVLPQLLPAGVFYLGLRGGSAAANSRAEAFADSAAARRRMFRHEGRFDSTWHAQLDAIQCQEQFSADYRVKLAADAFAQLMSDVEAHLARLGTEILDGKISIEPYRKNQRDTACLRCEFQGICRFDPWTEPYRALKPLPKKSPPEKAKA